MGNDFFRWVQNGLERGVLRIAKYVPVWSPAVVLEALFWYMDVSCIGTCHTCNWGCLFVSVCVFSFESVIFGHLR